MIVVKECEECKWSEGLVWRVGMKWRVMKSESEVKTCLVQVEETKQAVEQKEVEKGSGDAKAEATTEATDKEWTSTSISCSIFWLLLSLEHLSVFKCRETN